MSKYTGLIAGFVSALLFSVMALFVRVGHEHFTIGQLLFARALFGILVFGWLARAELPRLFSRESKFIWLRALFGGGSVACYFWNLADISLGAATVLTDMSPIFVAIFSVALYRQKAKPAAIIGAVLAFTGVVLLSQPQQGEIHWLSIVLGVLSAALSAMAYISLRQAASKYSSAAVVFAFSIALLVVALPDVGRSLNAEHWTHFLPLLAIVISSALAQWLMTVSYRYLAATTASTIGLSAVIWAMAFDSLFFGAPLTVTSLLATSAILVGIRITV